MGQVGRLEKGASMNYEQVKSLKLEDFRRLCEVHPETFTQMLEVVRMHSKPKRKTGRPGKLTPVRPIVDDTGILERVPHLLP